MISTSAKMPVSRRIGFVVMAIALAGTSLLMIAHLGFAHAGGDEGSHQDCKFCQQFSHNSAVPVSTTAAIIAAPSFMLAAESGFMADSLVVTGPRGRSPPAVCSIS